MTIDNLKEYLTKYGEINIINDISTLLQELGNEWKTSGKQDIAEVFFHSSKLLNEAAAKLQSAEDQYQLKQPHSDYFEKEYNQLMSFFKNISPEEIKELYLKKRQDLILKLKRLEFLQKIVNKNDKK